MNNNDLIQEAAYITKEDVVLAFDDVLDKDSFKKVIEENEIIQEWQVNRKAIKSSLTKALNAIGNNDVRKAYNIWETQLNWRLLHNKEYQQVSLLVLAGLNSSDLDIKYMSKEYDSLSKTGILSISQQNDAIGVLFKQALSSEWMQQHLDLMLYDIWSSQVQVSKSSRIHILFDNINKSDSFYKYLNKDTRQNTYKRLNLRRKPKLFTLKEFMYGDNPQWKGQAADAFLQHLAHMHVGLFADSSGLQNITNIENQPSVFEEEQSNIFELLLQSKNNIPWYTGGDLILKLGSGQILNIQLKTQGTNLSRQKQALNSSITTDKLAKLLIQIYDYFKDIEANKNELIELLFNELKTSAWIEQQASPAIMSAVAEKFAKS